MRRSNTWLMLSGILSDKPFAASLPVVAAALSLMYYNTISGSTTALSVLPMPHSAAASVWLGTVIALGIVSNIYVMKVLMGGGREAMKAASKTAFSMLAGAVGCVSSIASVLLSVGIGVESGVLAFLSTNMLPFFAVALITSLVSIKLAASTLANTSYSLKVNDGGWKASTVGETHESGAAKVVDPRGTKTWPLAAGVMASWGAYSIHHAYEAGLAQMAAPDAAAGAIEVVILASAMLIATIMLITRYGYTKGRRAFMLLSILVFIFWIGILGLFEGFYSHTLKDILYFFFNVAPEALPLPAPLRVIGLTYDVPTNMFGEATGVLPFVFGMWIAVAWRRLAAQHQ